MSNSGSTEPNEDDTEAQEYHIQCGGVDYHFVVFGKSGTGKSSLCNQLVDRDLQDFLKFRVGSGLSTVTVQYQQELAASPDGQPHFTVIDVPGESLDSHTKKFSLEKFVENLQQHIQELSSHGDRRCKTVIIICVRCDARYAAEEFRTYIELKDIWNDDDDFCERLVVAFTHGDKLVGDASDDEDDTESRKQPEMPAADGANKIREVGDGRRKTDETSGHPEGKDMPYITQQEAKRSEAAENQTSPAGQHDDGTSSSSGAAAKDADQAPGMLEKESAQEEVQQATGTAAVTGEGSANRAAGIETTCAERILAKKLQATWPQLMRLLSDSGHRYVLFNNKKGHKDERSVLKLLQIVQMMELTGVPNPKRENRAGRGDDGVEGLKETLAKFVFLFAVGSLLIYNICKYKR